MPEPALVVSVLLGLFCLLLVAGAANLVVMIKGAGEARKQRVRSLDESCNFLLEPGLAPEVAMIATPPDASEESHLYVRQLLKLHSDNYEVILVLDGASDSDLEIWKEAFHLRPALRSLNACAEAGGIRAIFKSQEPIRLTVVDRERAGESACLNTGILMANSPLVGIVDIHAQFSEDALLRLIRPMVNDPEGTIAVCGVAPAAPASGMAARLYRLESLRTWLGRCGGLSAWNVLLPAPGSFLLMRRDAVINAGGFRYGALDMIVRLHRAARAQGRPYSIPFIPGTVSRVVAPISKEKARLLFSWERSQIRRALRRNMGLYMRFGSLGWAALPGLLWSCYLRPAIKTALVLASIFALAIGAMEPRLLGMLLAAAVGFEILVSMSAVILHEYASQPEADPGELAGLFVCAIREQLGHRLWRSLGRS